MYLTIRTRYVPVSAAGGSKWVARCEGRQLTVPTDYAAGPAGASDAAADALAAVMTDVPMVALSVTHAGDHGAYIYVRADIADVIVAIDGAGTVADALRLCGSLGRDMTRIVRGLYAGVRRGQVSARSFKGTITAVDSCFVAAWLAAHPGAADAGLYAHGYYVGVTA